MKLRYWLFLFVGVLLNFIALSTGAAWNSSTPGAGGWYEAVGIGPTGVTVIGSDLSGAYISKNGGQSWTIVGVPQGLTATHIAAIGFHRTDPNIILLGADLGLYRSANQGNTFTKITSIPATGYVTAIQSAPSTPAIMYAAVHTLYNQAKVDIYRSTDSGNTWLRQTSNPLSKLRIQKLVIHPTKPNELYVVSAPDRFSANTLDWSTHTELENNVVRKVYRSTDSGKTWSVFAGNAAGKKVFDFALVNSNPLEMYLSTDLGVFYSSNAGNSWLNTGLPPETNYDGFNVGYGLWLNPINPNQVRAFSNALTIWGTGSGIWLGTKAGSSFSWKTTTPKLDEASGKWTKLGWDLPDYWNYAARRYLGETPTQIDSLLTGFYFGGESLRTMAIDPRDANRMLFVNSLWAFQTIDGGVTFNNVFTNRVSTGQASRGLNNVNVYTVTASRWTNSNVLLAGYADIGCWRSVNNGVSWESCQAPGRGWWGDNGGNVTAIVTDPTRTGVVWAAMGTQVDSNISLVHSNQSGKFNTWTSSMGGIPAVDAKFIYGLSVDVNSPSTNRTMFVTANGNVYKSSDDGKNWQKVLDCRARTASQTGGQAYCTATAVDYFNRNLVYAGGSAGLFTSQDGGTTWTWTEINRMTTPTDLDSVFQPWGGRYFISGIAADPLVANKVYIAIFDQRLGSNRGGIWQGVKGTNWQQLYKNPYMRAVVSSPYKSGELIAASSMAYTSGGYADQATGIVMRNPSTGAWSQVNQGLAFNNLSSISYTPVVGQMIIGSMGQGVMRNW